MKHKPLTYDERRMYVEAPAQCPYCDGWQFTTGAPKMHEGDAVVKRQVTCKSCKRTWNDVYNLTDIEELP
jgi:hypothetical protein